MKKNKKKSLIHVLSLLIIILTTIFGCDDDPLECSGENGSGSGSVVKDCSQKSTLGTKYQWFTIYGTGAPHYYGDGELLGKWICSSADFEFTLNADGTGTWHFLGSAFVPASTKKIKWGVLVNKSDCSKSGGSNWMVNMVNEPPDGNLIDAQFGSSTYLSGSKKWSNGYTR